MITIETVKNIYDKRLSSWNDLVDRTAMPLFFQRYEWVECWWRNFAANNEKIFIMLATEGSELIGIAPLMYRRNALSRYNLIRFIGSGHFDYFDFIIKKGEEKEVIGSFIDYINREFGYFEMELKKDFGDSPAFKALTESLVSKKFDGVIYPEDVVPCIELPETKQQFYCQTKKSLKSDIARQQRRLEESGELDLKECDNLNNAMDTLEDFFSLHIKKWELARGYSAYKFKRRRDLLRNLLESSFDSKIVNLYYLLYNKRKLAICLAFKINKRFVYYAPCYDSEFAKYSPGKILINKLIDYSIDNQCKEFDFGIGNESYKLEWPCKIKKLYNVYIYSNKDNFLKAFLKSQRYIISSYFLRVLPRMRKLHLAVYIWRWLNKIRGRYRRFQ